MKNFLIIAFVTASFVFVVPVAQARTTTENVTNITLNNEQQRRYGQNRRVQQQRRIQQNRRIQQQRRIQQNRRIIQNRRYNPRYNNRNRARVTYTTRTVRRGNALYRETYQVRYLPNGRSQTRLVNRVRIR